MPNKKQKAKKVGDKVVILMRKPGSRNTFIIKGKIKEIRDAYGFSDYLITEGVASDFYTRNIEK